MGHARLARYIIVGGHSADGRRHFKESADLRESVLFLHFFVVNLRLHVSCDARVSELILLVDVRIS